MVTHQFDGSLINYHLMRLRLNSHAIEPKYFVYFVRGSSTVTDYIREVNHGATRDGINTAQLLNLLVALPPLPEQHRIVAAIETQLTRLDAGVASLKAAQTRLRRYRVAVLKAACEGRLVPQDPSDEPASVLLERIREQREPRTENREPARGLRGRKREEKQLRMEDLL